MDWLQVVIVILMVALAVGLVAGTIVVAQNLASKTLVLAGSAFAATMVGFLINLWTELRPLPPRRAPVSVTVLDELEIPAGAVHPLRDLSHATPVIKPTVCER